MIDVQRLLDYAETTIKKHLPDGYEIDDVEWSDNGFVIKVFDARTLEAYRRGAVDRFMFTRSGKPDEEELHGFYRELDRFCRYWRRKR